MDGDWDEIARIPLPPPGVRAHPTPVSTLAFDTAQELLWAGNQYGRVTSFYGHELLKYTSFKAHTSQDGPVHQLLFNDKGVIAVGSKSVHMAARRGGAIWTVRHSEMKELRCMSFTSKGTAEILVAGEQDKMFVIDVHKGEVTKTVPTDSQYKIMRRSRFICAATVKGAVHILDPITFKVVKVWNAHSAAINDMDAQHDFIVTCGFSVRQNNNYMLDPLVNVFDLKNMISLSPIPFPAGAAFVRMHPRMSTTSIVMSQIGQMHVVDLMNPNTSNVRQANSMSFFSMIEIASSGEAIVLADHECNIHLWGSPNKIHFSEYVTPVDFADGVPSAPQMDWNSDTPLSTVGMPYYREVLLSAWPDMVTELGAPAPKIEPQALAGLQERDWGFYGKNTRGLRRNQVEDTRTTLRSSHGLTPFPKFLSEKARDLAKSPAGTPAPEETFPEYPLVVADTIESHKVEVPDLYQPVEIKYSKFGIDDFDFAHYNKTPYSGLQNHIVNAYVNSLLQIMHYTPLVRNIALRHAATACVDETCILCELGFLFDMLQKAEGDACQASNLTKTLSHHPHAARLNLLEEENPNGSRTVMLQQLVRFLLQEMARNHAAMLNPRERVIEDVRLSHLFHTTGVSSIRCHQCRGETTKPDFIPVNELIYPPASTHGRNTRAPKTTFSQVLKQSVERETVNKGWCNNCRRYQTLATRRTIHKIPGVLMLTTGISSSEHRRLWATPGFLPEEIGIIVDNGQFFCYEGEDLKLHLQRAIHNITVYSLTGVATSIEDGQQQRSHLIATVNVAHSAPQAPGANQWYTLNDFAVNPVTPEEALTFNSSWKSPSVVIFQVKTANNKIDSDWKNSLDPTLLYLDLQSDREPTEKTYRTLNRNTEAVGPKTIVAIDTEFVQVSQPEIEINSDGERNIIRPITHALARTSILRGWSGDSEGVPFIDDYITMKEKVVDYLTSYSGITAEDLDPEIAHQRGHNLVPLKIAYKKIWILLNLGCTFLGHGLKQDFRVINIHVPKSQVIDTSDIFYIKERFRKLSLQFLAHTLLHEDIQQLTHDSIEDARTALLLYKKYLEFTHAGILDARLAEVYKAGAASGFKPPNKANQQHGNNAATPGGGNGSARTDTPPVGGGGGIGSGGPTTPVRKGGGSGGFGSVLGSGGVVFGSGGGSVVNSPASNAGWGTPGRGGGGGVPPPPGFR
ncbi:ubiquitin carboxyl-terminal hydrolase-domain-containing protein [Microdochium bolleyi]|uniref:PAN2-PAN3 deadenylation complex catalytic subunit PAN2 n=1 Tax=Microdochium bolleyi TaxID=196109 RepID=A0A136IYG1_9PEZI|nr:ubiquitin carboxyl-terminal hydrolase-domain-containing protein [Microdochium bolleyi]